MENIRNFFKNFLIGINAQMTYFSDIYFAISIDLPKFKLKCFNLIPI